MSTLFKRNESLLITIVMLLFFLRITFSMEPQRPGEIEKYRKDGSLSERVEYAKKMGNYKVSSDLVKRKIEQMKALEEGKSFDSESFPYTTGLPSSGYPDIFVLLIDFPDYPHTNTQSIVDNKVFGGGNWNELPYESLKEYYYRSSYNDLYLGGDVLPWYRAASNRSNYTTYEELIMEALKSYEGTYDFAQYDNNSDGIIDYFAVLWTGPDTGWGSFWWGYCCGWNVPSYTIDGKHLGTYSWQWEANPVGTEFSPRTLIHETGHGLGLPDYYDYDGNIGPDGALGGFDMMDAASGDHNGFSKWLLNWNTPTVIGSTTNPQSILLRPSSDFRDCVIIMPGQTISQPFREYYVVQNRSRFNDFSNDYYFPNNGLLIWHVDATLNSTNDNFQYNNSYTDHKLIRLMEADGREEIEQNLGGNAGDFYTQYRYISPDSTPNSNDYVGNYTGIYVMDIVPVTSSSSFRANFVCSGADLQGLSEAIDNCILYLDYGGDQTWFGEKLISFYGGDAVQSGSILDNQISYIQTTFTGSGTLKFHWKVSSEAYGDYLEFYIDDVLQSRISGEVDWQQRSYNISSKTSDAMGPGTHTAKWIYTKNGSFSSGSDCGWVDRLRFEMGSLANGLDNYNLAWTTRGDAEWFYETENYYIGSDAVQSGSLSQYQTSILETSVSGPGTLRFYYKDSDVSSSGRFEFYIDGEYTDTLSKNDWTQLSYAIPWGQHILTWQFTMDGTTPDTAYLDYVYYNPDMSIGEAVDYTPVIWYTYGDGFWYGEEQSYYYAYDAAQSGYITNNQISYLETTMSGPSMISFYWMVSSESNDYLEFYIDYVLKDKISGVSVSNPWSQKTYYLSSGYHSLLWCYVKDVSGSAGADCGRVDKVVWTPIATFVHPYFLYE